jgi:hypothetical protein
MSRIRVSLLLLAFALLVPASASANPWATLASPLATCPPTDDVVVADPSINETEVPTSDTSWSRLDVSVTLEGEDAESFEWMIDCGPVETGPTAVFTGTGAHSFWHRAKQTGVDEWTPWKEDTVYVDQTPPTDTSDVPEDWQVGGAEITFDADDEHSGVLRLVYELDGFGEVPVDAGTKINITGNGTHALRTKAVDKAGNQSAWTNHTVKVDSSGPLDTTNVPLGWVTTPSLDVEITGTDTGGSGIALIEWELPDDGRSGSVPGPGPVTVNVSGEGEHRLRTELTDGLNFKSGVRTRMVRIDSVPPTDHTNVTSAWLPRNTYDVTVHGTDATSGVAAVEYRIDGGDTVSTNAATVTATVAGAGEHTLETSVVDVAGNRSPWVAHTVRLDPDAPVNLTPKASDAWRQDSYAVRPNGDDGLSGVHHVSWKINHGGEHTGAPNATTVTVSGDGVHTFSTRVQDNAGNYSAWRDETIRIDSVKPVDTTTVDPVVPGGRKVTITGTDDNSGLSGAVEWVLDNGPTRTSAQVTLFGPGAHVLKTRVQDNAGNWSEWRTHNVTVDGALPLEDSDAPVDLTTAPSKWRTGPVNITVSADDGEGVGVDYVEYRVDGRIESVANGTTFTVSTDGVHEIDTRATDHAGNTSEWRTHTVKIDTTPPAVDELAPGWVKSRDVKITGTDETSGVKQVRYRVNGAADVIVAGDQASFTLPGDGTFTVAYRVEDNAGQSTAWKTAELKVDTVAPVNTSAAAPTAWQRTPLALDLTGTDVGSGLDHAEWRVGGGTPKVGNTTAVTTEGTQTLETRVVDKAGNESPWRAETIKVDLTKPVNTTPVVTQAWRNTNFATTVSGTDAVSGVAEVEWKLDAGAPSTSPAVSITREGNYTLYSRVLDKAGNASEWRADRVGIDKTKPTLAVDCGGAGWRNAPAVCSVTASGGLSGLSVLTGARGGEGPIDVVGGVFTVEAEGSSNLTFRAVDGAGNEVSAQGAVKVDRTPPAATVACVPDAKSDNYICTVGGSDGLSGLTGLAWSRDGGAATPIAAGATFSVPKGTVVVRATDAAGNAGTSAPVTLAARKAAAGGDGVTPRTSSEAVLIKGRGKASKKRLVGQLTIAGTPTATTADLRPLALGKGTFRLTLKVKVGKKTKTVTKTQKAVKGYSKRLTVKTVAGADAKVTLTVKRKSGRRWVTHATATVRL